LACHLEVDIPSLLLPTFLWQFLGLTNSQGSCKIMLISEAVATAAARRV